MIDMKIIDVSFNGMEKKGVESGGKIFYRDACGNYYRLNRPLGIWHSHDGRKLPHAVRDALKGLN